MYVGMYRHTHIYIYIGIPVYIYIYVCICNRSYVNTYMYRLSYLCTEAGADVLMHAGASVVVDMKSIVAASRA